jgi:hypothetical protein
MTINGINNTDSENPMVIHEALPMDAMTQIFARVGSAATIQIRSVCHQWEQIITEMGKAEIKEIRATHAIALSILSEGVEYPLFQQVKIYREIDTALQSKVEVASEERLTANPMALSQIVCTLVRRGYIEDALNVVHCFPNGSFKIELLATAIAYLAGESLPEGEVEGLEAFEEAKKLRIQRFLNALHNVSDENALEDSALDIVGYKAELGAMNLLLSFGQTHSAEALLNWCYLEDCAAEERDENLEALALAFNTLPGSEAVIDMINTIRQREVGQRALGPGQA